MNNSILDFAIQAVKKSQLAFCKFISANDAGATGGHQAGFYMSKTVIPLMFDSPCIRGENKEKLITIKWQNEFETHSRFIYYGKGTRNEYRLTRFGKGFNLLNESSTGNLFILCKMQESHYEAYILESEEETELFLAMFNLEATQTNNLIAKTNELSVEDQTKQLFFDFIKTTTQEFPDTAVMAHKAREIYNKVNLVTVEMIKAKPDYYLLEWINTEYELFKAFENNRYSPQLSTPFLDMESLVAFSNTVLNRRKSRAGKSLEHHLSYIFSINELEFENQAITELNKKPDFLFPNSAAYHAPDYSPDHLAMLGAKTTCKDRWRQILTEANRIPTKHLFTLQQGISKNQLDEMCNSHVQLVIPKNYIALFEKSYQNQLITLEKFIAHIKSLVN